ncbi:hypothetical protein D3C86_1379230 [compost metagenome]
MRCTPYAALAGVVDPRQARFLDLVDGLVDQDHAAGHARWSGDLLFVVVQDVVGLPGIDAFHQLRESQFVFVLDNVVRTIGLRGSLGRNTFHVAAAITVGVVPVHLHTVLWNRERVIAGLSEVHQAVAIGGQFGGYRAFPGDVIDVLWRGCGALGLEHRDLVAVRIALEHRQLARGQLVLVLVDIGCRDHELRFFAGKRIAEKTIVECRRAGFEAPGPGRNAAVGIALFLCPQRRQRSPQLRRLLWRNRGHHTAGQQRQTQCASAQN